MKRAILLLIPFFLLSVIPASSQVPLQFNYQAVARNANGSPVTSQLIRARLRIRSGSSTGTIEYSETRLISTNPFGLFSIAVGSPGAANSTGSISGINWRTNPRFLQVEIDPAGGIYILQLHKKAETLKLKFIKQ